MNKRLRLLLRQATFNLRGGFLVRPLAIALALGFAGALLSWLEETFPCAQRHCAERALSLSLRSTSGAIHSGRHRGVHHDGGFHCFRDPADDPDAGLHAVFAAHYREFYQGPRDAMDARHISWHLLLLHGRASGTARLLPRPFAPVATVMGAMLLALACVAWLLFFIHHISHAISVSHIVDRIASETEVMIDEMMPWPHRLNAMA